MATELRGGTGIHEASPLLEADCILWKGENCLAQAIRLADEALNALALPQEAFEKIHLAIRAAMQDDIADPSEKGDIRLHIIASESQGIDPSRNSGFAQKTSDAHQTWGMFLVQHPETSKAGWTRQLIELRLYREMP